MSLSTVHLTETGQTAPRIAVIRKKTAFYAALEATGMPRIRFHDMRHTAATLLLAKGVHPKIVSEMLGHSTIGLTLDTCSHLLPAMHQQAAATMDAILAG